MSDETNQSGPSDGTAADNNDDARLEELAEQFLALWREQVAATADGAHAASAIGRLYASLGADTTRMGEGFEAWGNLIGQMAMGQHPTSTMANPLGAAAGIPGAGENPLMAMMEQMAKAAKELPASPFTAGMPFPPNMADMAKMAGMATPTGAAQGATGGKTGKATEGTSDAPSKPSDGESASETTAGSETENRATGKDQSGTAPTKGVKKKSAAKKAAKGQGKNDQSTKAQAASTQKGQSKAGGAKAASDAHGSRDDELAELTRRIADLSETIAALEAGTEGTGGKPPEGD